MKLQEQWRYHLADNDLLNQSFLLKSRIGVALQSLYESATEYTDKDLVVSPPEQAKSLEVRAPDEAGLCSS